MKKNKVIKYDSEFRALSAVMRHFKKLGWNILIARFAQIEQGNAPHNFRLIIEFTGGKIKGWKPKLSGEEGG